MALLLVVVVAAGEATVASASRARLGKIANGRAARAERLQAYVAGRASVLGALAVARNLGVVIATALGVFLTSRESGHSWGELAALSVVAVVVLAVLDALPRLLIARSPEAWGLRLVPVIAFVRAVFGPVAWAIDRSLRTVVGANAAAEPSDAEDEELLRLVEDEGDGRPIEEDEREMIRGIMDMDVTTAREIMAPRIDIVALEVDATIDDAVKVIVDKGFSRIPTYDETIDNIVGIVYAKDLLRCLAENRRPPLKEIARPPYFIPESKKVDELLAELRQSKVHIAIVVDEYGGTAGLVTIEDLLEEIVGEIQDEYDREEAPIERVNDSEAILDARVSIDALEELFGFQPEDEHDYDTVGGFVYHHLGKVPVAGDEVRVDGLTLRVLSVLGRRIKKVRAKKIAEEPTARVG
ncbi:MAG: hemolysin family protein [Dehalococcoidia bacterium]